LAAAPGLHSFDEDLQLEGLMGYRRFSDRDGNDWEVQDYSNSEWRLLPVFGNRHPSVTVRPPNYESDPFELSTEELQRLLDAAQPPRSTRSKNPFLD
jgi:hypothetical protein